MLKKRSYLASFCIPFRSVTPSLQIQVSSRIVEKIDFPNLLVVSTTEWERSLIFNPRLNSVPIGWGTFNVGDRNTYNQLGLPVLQDNNGSDLYLMATGGSVPLKGSLGTPPPPPLSKVCEKKVRNKYVSCNFLR